MEGSSGICRVPTIGSIPSNISIPLPTCQARHFPIHGRVWMRPFQITEACCMMKFVSLRHATIDWFFKYLLIKTRCERPLLWRTIQKCLALSAILNQNIFLIPQPPKAFGHVRCSQLTRWYLRLSPFEPQRKAKVRLMSLLRTEMGLGASPSQ